MTNHGRGSKLSHHVSVVAPGLAGIQLQWFSNPWMHITDPSIWKILRRDVQIKTLWHTWAICRLRRCFSAVSEPCYISLSENMEQRLILINLLVKLGLAAALASALVRSAEFKSLLF